MAYIGGGPRLATKQKEARRSCVLVVHPITSRKGTILVYVGKRTQILSVGGISLLC